MCKRLDIVEWQNIICEGKDIFLQYNVLMYTICILLENVKKKEIERALETIRNTNGSGESANTFLPKLYVYGVYLAMSKCP